MTYVHCSHIFANTVTSVTFVNFFCQISIKYLLKSWGFLRGSHFLSPAIPPASQ